MAGEVWTEEEIQYIRENGSTKSCHLIAKELGRTTRATQHKFAELGLEKARAKIGDVVNGWEILDIYTEYKGNQNIKIAKIKSTLEDATEKTIYLTKLTNKQIGWPDRRRPDVTIKNTTHGLSKSRLYSIWSGMKNRCLNPKQNSYKDYGGRGISIYQDWMDFDNFRKWAESNGYDETLTLDRIDVDKNYCPENCKWANWGAQCSNRRNSFKIDITAFGETKDLYEWCKDNRCTIRPTVLAYRINAGWEPELAITQPSERKKKESFEEWAKLHHPDIYQQYLLS